MNFFIFIHSFSLSFSFPLPQFGSSYTWSYWSIPFLVSLRKLLVCDFFCILRFWANNWMSKCASIYYSICFALWTFLLNITQAFHVLLATKRQYNRGREQAATMFQSSLNVQAEIEHLSCTAFQFSRGGKHFGFSIYISTRILPVRNVLFQSSFLLLLLLTRCVWSNNAHSFL